MGWKSGNDKIDGLIQLKINERSDTRFKWIPYNQFNRIKNIGKGHFVTVYSATWEYEVALVCFNDSQKFLYKVKESDNKFEMYGISQNPDIKDYILVLQNEYCMEYGKTYCKNCGEKYGHIDHTWFIEYADGGSYNNWISINYRDFDWRNKIQTLLSIIEGLKGIHKKQKVHHDFHTGNILFLTKNLNILNRKSLFISDMGLCEDLNNTSEVKTYGVIPYMAPEVLRRKPYTQAADIYSFEICNGIRPKINKLEAPKYYINLMRRCWDSNPGNRPSAAEIHVEIKSFYDCYSSYKKGDSNAIEIKKQFKEAEIYRKSHLSSFKRNKQHSGAIYTSRSLDPFTKDLLEYDNSECVSCIITD
ncbi:kinase-like domain-containing protein [Rhizophagus irregularis DAOM 181602=DAOM 197198]|nr:kinase-like domain-containing protein [Rhizophagus irregularis DAOM 181602=DAOM 197198]